VSGKSGRKWDPFRIVFVCTGNVCRSALAERLGRAFLEESLGRRAVSIHLESAGVRAVVGAEMDPDSGLVLQGFGGDPHGFAARQFEPELVAHADLVLTMTRDHRRQVLERAPKALPRTFTLREAADLAAGLGDDIPGRTFQERARQLVTRLAASRTGRQGSRADDVADPIGRSVEVHQQVGEAIAEALLPLLRRITALHGQAEDRGPARARVS
jgi:protein-tyrosine-phosphatase